MGGISNRLLPECIVLDLNEESKEGVIRRLVEAVDRAHSLSDAKKLMEDILEREQLASTSLGLGCAIPHAHSLSLDETVIAAARLSPPRAFDAPDGEPISLVFLIAGPESNAGLHLRLLSKLARLLHNARFRDEIRGVGNAENFCDLICRWDE